MVMKQSIAASAAALVLAVSGKVAYADEHAFTEGTVSQVTSVRTVDGHFDDYMAWVDTVWKKEQEAAKKAGYIVSYQVFAAQPRSEKEADLYLVLTYKNYAALDDWIVKGDTIAKQIDQ